MSIERKEIGNIVEEAIAAAGPADRLWPHNQVVLDETTLHFLNLCAQFCFAVENVRHDLQEIIARSGVVKGVPVTPITLAYIRAELVRRLRSIVDDVPLDLEKLQRVDVDLVHWVIQHEESQDYITLFMRTLLQKEYRRVLLYITQEIEKHYADMIQTDEYITGAAKQFITHHKNRTEEELYMQFLWEQALCPRPADTIALIDLCTRGGALCRLMHQKDMCVTRLQPLPGTKHFLIKCQPGLGRYVRLRALDLAGVIYRCSTDHSVTAQAYGIDVAHMILLAYGDPVIDQQLATLSYSLEEADPSGTTKDRFSDFMRSLRK